MMSRLENIGEFSVVLSMGALYKRSEFTEHANLGAFEIIICDFSFKVISFFARMLKRQTIIVETMIPRILNLSNYGSQITILKKRSHDSEPWVQLLNE